MANPVVKLIGLQNGRILELEAMSNRLKARPRDEFNLNLVRGRLDTLYRIWEECRTGHTDIVMHDDEEVEVYISSGNFTRFQVIFEEVQDFLLTLLSEIELANETTLSARRSSIDGSSEDGESAANLPKLNLPTFSGEFNDWENFRDLFTTLVHNRARISNATKLQYLKTCLKGAAADLVKDVATTDANYDSTWQALNDRFYNPELLVNNHIQKLLDLPFLKKESAADLQSFTDEALRVYRALKNLDHPVENWDVWFNFILAARLDPESRKAWEFKRSQQRKSASLEANSSGKPKHKFSTFAELSEFLQDRTRTLGMIASDVKSNPKGTGTSKPVPGSKRAYHAAFGGDANSKCPLCSGNHSIRGCSKFKAKTPFERREEARRLKLCFNCLGKHKFSDCKSQGRCSVCQGRHHSMIHYNSSKPHSAQNTPSDGKKTGEGGADGPVNVHTSNVSFPQQISVILATAQFTIIGPCGNQTRVRALLDQGSESSFVSDRIAELINLPKTPVRVPLTGLGAQDVGMARFSTQFILQSLVNPSFKLNTQALILQKLTAQLPSRKVVDLNLESLADLQLADPHFHVPDSIDVILGADIYGQLLLSGLRRFPSSSLVAQKTTLGWIVSGSVVSGRAETSSSPPVAGFHCAVQADLNESLQHLCDQEEALSCHTKTRFGSSVNTFHCATETDLNETLQRFWDLEEVPSPKNPLNPDDSACEELFANSHTRDSTGRFVVHLPLKSCPPEVASETRGMALGSLSHMQRRFDRDLKLAQGYREFMSTYETLGHMERVPAAEIHNSHAWYLPHHAVVQSSPQNWKLRVVFDASRQTRDKVCLNDFLLSGPALQNDLALILLNWRRYRFVFTADIVKMFRQIKIAAEDQNWQRIVWSPDSVSPPIDYRLTTVTYGTNCAPYLAIRTLLQLARDGKACFPMGARCLESHAYVDDIFTGADDLVLAIQARQELVELLKSAGIVLDKWAANHSDLLPPRSSIPDESKSIELDKSVKTLGIQWNPLQDEFGFTTLDLKTLTSASTKRAVLSTISKLFDPLGWLAPVTVTAKILMQDLWITKCGWDDPLPPDIRERWLEYCRSLTALPSLSIGRWFGTRSASNLQLHGFCDASSRAYAAAVYLRVEEGDGRFRVVLLAAKSKVAPVKTISIPNLELCGAVLLVKLIRYLQRTELLHKLPVFARSDSQIVLKYLQKHPCLWKTFIANRVSFIQTELPSAVWSHVPTKENPADLATRGFKPIELSESRLWWCGPDWLAMSEENWPQPAKIQTLHAKVAKQVELPFFSKFSSLDHLTRVVARLLRGMTDRARVKKGLDPLPGLLTALEFDEARVAIIKSVQAGVFRREIGLLQRGKRLPKKHPLLKLNPFVDVKDGLLRVGGRLAHSGLCYQRKHPAILPRSSHVSRLFVRQAHHSCLHGGPTLTTSTLNQRVWLLGRNRLVKFEIRTCVRCQRANPRLAHQMMGDLPAERTVPSRPFTYTGLDYAGPFQVRAMSGRGHKVYKGYIVLFVCFSTRAIHLEVVEDLQSVSFLAAYQRFAGRRGVCRNLFSDNATTFQGADRELQSMFNAASKFYKEAATALARDGTQWNFIPPNSPHYGGLWEAGVKSVKNHLKRAIGDRSYTFAELSTILVQIEACLNSRPLSPLSSDIEDLHALTPFHFLNGGVSGLIPDEEPPTVPENRLSRFQLLQAVKIKFWKRWSGEYLQHLQERAKWRSPNENFAVGKLVIMRDDRFPPSKWPLGRVTEVHPGPDGLVRVVTVRTATSTLKRHIVRLCPLLLETDFPKKST